MTDPAPIWRVPPVGNARMPRSFFSHLFARKRRKTTPPPLVLPETMLAIYERARRGHHLDQVLWGKALLKSTFLPPDHEQAIIWFTMASNAGYGPASNMLGRCHHFGWGVPKSFEQAAIHYARAAEQNDEWGRYNLGILTLRGLGMPQNLPRAFSLFARAAENGHAKSMNILARFYEEGWTVPPDPERARALYRASAEGGDYRGCHNHATVLTQQDAWQEALHWWTQAQPHATSDILLAMERSLSALIALPPRSTMPPEHAAHPSPEEQETARALLEKVRARIALVVPEPPASSPPDLSPAGKAD
ncbi:UNVERIFIED_CONTAM: hypothetical protein JM85_1684 [Acetobacter peroxydans]